LAAKLAYLEAKQMQGKKISQHDVSGRWCHKEL